MIANCASCGISELEKPITYDPETDQEVCYSCLRDREYGRACDEEARVAHQREGAG